MGFLTFLFLTALSFQFTPLATEISHKEFKTVLAHFEYLLEIYWNNFFHPTVFSCNMACSYLSHQILISSKKTGWVSSLRGVFGWNAQTSGDGIIPILECGKAQITVC